MGTAYLYGNGGSGGGSGGMELTIVGGTTRPAKVTHNTIWVNTEHAITGYVLSATKPNDPIEGTLWLKIANSGDIKATVPVGKEWITVYPLSAELYVGETWVNVHAMSYQNGEWADWFTYLFKNGNQYSDKTGGWIKGSGSTQANATVTVGNTIKIQSQYTSGAVFACTKNKMDLTDYHTLVVKVSSIARYLEDYDPAVRIQIHNSMNYDDYVSRVYVAGTGEYRIPLDGISSGYPSIAVYCATVEVAEVTLMR